MPSRYEKYATHHTSRRTEGWDYTRPAAYFVTMCTQDRVRLFGAVQRGRMLLNPLGRIVAEEWRRSDAIRDRVHLDAFVVMPNHLHGIVVFADPEVDAPTRPRGYRVFGTDPNRESTGGSDDVSGSTLSFGGKTGRRGESGNNGDADGDRPTGPPPRSLGSMIAGFKSAATTRINRHRGTPGAPVWQRNYHDRIIWTERHWRAAREYIRRNPAEWGGNTSR